MWAATSKEREGRQYLVKQNMFFAEKKNGEGTVGKCLEKEDSEAEVISE